MAIIKIRGILVDMLLDISPDVYYPYLIIDCNIFNKLTTQYMNTVYGTMISSLLYYSKFLSC